MALFCWLNTPRSFVWLVVTGTLIMLAVSFLGIVCSIAYFVVFGSSMMPDWQGLEQMTERELIGFMALNLCCAPFGSFFEELISRAPLSLVGKIWPESMMPFLSAIVCSILFGWLHGGWATVPYHGTCGLILSLFYLKAGGQQGKLFRPLLVSFLIHTIYDMVLSGIALSFSLIAVS